MRRIYELIGFKVETILAILIASAPVLAQKAPTPAASSVLTIGGITGESQTVPGGIDILSYSLSMSVPPGGRANFGDFTFVANTSSASPALLLNLATGRISATAVLYVRRSDLDQQYLKYTLGQVVISSLQPANESYAGLPKEQFSLRYRRIEIEYHVINPDGTLGPPIIACYDLATAREC